MTTAHVRLIKLLYVPGRNMSMLINGLSVSLEKEGSVALSKMNWISESLSNKHSEEIIPPLSPYSSFSV